MAKRCVLMLAVGVAATSPARADERVPNPSLRAVIDRVVRLELGERTPFEGRLLAFDEASVTIARTTTHEVLTLPRAQLLRLTLLEPRAADATSAIATAPTCYCRC